MSKGIRALELDSDHSSALIGSTLASFVSLRSPTATLKLYASASPRVHALRIHKRSRENFIMFRTSKPAIILNASKKSLM